MILDLQTMENFTGKSYSFPAPVFLGVNLTPVFTDKRLNEKIYNYY